MRAAPSSGIREGNEPVRLTATERSIETKGRRTVTSSRQTPHDLSDESAKTGCRVGVGEESYRFDVVGRTYARNHGTQPYSEIGFRDRPIENVLARLAGGEDAGGHDLPRRMD